MSHGSLLGIATRTKSRAAMDEHSSIEITVDRGAGEDFRGKPNARQITVLSVEDWEAAETALGTEIPWTTRRANLLVSGLSLAETTGATIRIGDSVELLITGETDPCARMDQQVPGLKNALAPNWRGGVCCKVQSAGTISIGDPVSIRLGDGD